ncbi:MerR family transcriptional regulator [Kitasatospora sp. NPDC052896]|uniref:MerR family transcriptional regulator n=1 Tax=Kitasatospora sp. NPDC052896 TaxID=3364061 RepID=UPI0037C5C989
MAESTTGPSIGQVTEQTGSSVHALRFHECEGLFVHPVRRGPGGRLPRYADLVGEGSGNEEERLSLMREHHEHVTTQNGRLTECLDLIRFKVGGAAAHQCHGPSPSTDHERGPLLRHEAAVA